MRNLKKFLALVLAMMMTLSLMVTVNAADTKYGDMDEVIAEFQDDVTVLDGMGIIRGWNDEFHPQDLVTRAQMAAFIYRLKTGDYSDKHDNLYVNVNEFEDVDPTDWYAGYIGFCAEARIMEGWENKAHPDEYVTGYQALTMILRAMGANEPGHNFTGANFGLDAASMATSYGMLATVNKSSYAHSLSAYATRELVAELTFQGAITPQVQWTNAFGYQQYGMIGGVLSSTPNPSLGYQNYGLDSVTSIILGNQATGESCTLLSAKEVSYTATVDGKDVTLTAENPHPYAYPGFEAAAADVTPNAKAAFKIPTGLKLAGTTGLDLFGHEVKAWYNAKDPSSAKQTYAILDRAELSATVYSPDATNGPKLSDSGFTTNAAAAKSLGAAAIKAGFAVDLEADEAHVSNVYSRIADATAPAAGTASPNGLYALISNNSDKTVDVIIPLSAEVAEITQKNTIASTQTLTLSGRGIAATTPQQDLSASTFGTAGVIKIDSLVEGSETGLGAKVTAWEVKGTNNKTAYGGDDPTDGSKATNGNMPYYQLDKVEKSITGTVVSYDANANGKLTMSDGKVYERSYLWSKVVNGAIESPLVSGTVTFAAGVNYTVWLDNDGRWLGATTAYSDFLYGTYADYSVGELGSAEMKYYVTGVTIDGTIVKNVPMNSLLQGGQPYPGTTPDVKSLGDGYNVLGISKKDMGAADGGNQVLPGNYTGYLKDSEGNFDADDLGDIKLLNATGKKWTITKEDVANGFADLNDPKDGKLVATKDTTFILVSGTGINSVKVEKLEGIEALLKGYNKVELYAEEVDHATAPAYGNTYYIMAADRFNNVDTRNNTLVDTVILDARDLTYIGATSLFFALDSNTTDVVLAGTDPAKVKQYKLYNDGVLGTYFVNISTTDMGVDAVAPTCVDSSGDFFELVKAYEVNGVPVYKAIAASDQNSTANLDMANTSCDTDVKYNYVGVSNLLTAWLEKGTGKTLANVANAKVVDVEFNADCEHTEITSIEDLNRAVSGLDSWSGAIELAIVNDGVNVTMIYVTKVP